MKHYHLTIESKNKNTLDSFLKLFKNTELTNFNFLQKYFKNKKKKQLLTLLKSPHVNKSAQEQFETKLYTNKIVIYSPKNFQSLIFLKKIKINVFPEVKIKIKIFANTKLQVKTQKQILNPNNFQLNYFHNLITQISNVSLKKPKKKVTNNFSKKQINSLLKVFDIYGELNF